MSQTAIEIANRWMLGWPKTVKGLIATREYLEALKYQEEGEAGYQHEPSVKQGKERGNTRFRNWQRAAYMTFSIDPTFSLGRSSMSFGPLLYLPDYLLMTQSIRLFSASP